MNLERCPACNNDGRSDACAFCTELHMTQNETLDAVAEACSYTKIQINERERPKFWVLNNRKWYSYYPGEVIEVTDEEVRRMIRDHASIQDILEARNGQYGNSDNGGQIETR